jgi:pyruvate/2-oxoglutarate dehydrogenase complex dihydrolipoamide acyltransferase (E2) component
MSKAICVGDAPRTTIAVSGIATWVSAPGESGSVDLGIAVAVDNGLVIPVLRGADRQSLREIARNLSDLADRARSGKLGLADMRGAIATVSHVGSCGNLTAFRLFHSVRWASSRRDY